MKPNHKLYFWGLILSLFFIQCSEDTQIDVNEVNDKEEEVDTSLNLKSNQNVYASMEDLKITSDSYDFTEDSYELDLEGYGILEFTNINDTLVAFVPVVDNNSYTLSMLTDDGYSDELNIQVENYLIEDVNTLFNDTIQTRLSNMNEILVERVKNTPEDESLLFYQELLDSYLENASSYSEEEKIEFTYFYRANQEAFDNTLLVFDNLEGKTLSTQSNNDNSSKPCSPDNWEVVKGEFSETSIKYAGAAVGIGWVFAAEASAWGGLASVFGKAVFRNPYFTAGVVVAVAILAKEMIRSYSVATNCSLPVEFKKDSWLSKKNNNAFYNKDDNSWAIKNKETVQLDPKITFANISDRHRDDKFSGYETFFTAYDRIKDAWTDSIEYINDYIKEVSDNINYFFSTGFNPTPIPSDFTGIPSELENQVEVPIESSTFSIEGVDSDANMIYSVDENGILEISFDVETIEDLPKTIEAQLVYDDGVISFSDDITFVIENYIELEVVSGGDQTGTVEEVLEEAIVIKATDFNGEPAEGVEINLEIAEGESELSSSTLTTNAEGEASFEWTLISQGDHLVNAQIRSDGEVIEELEIGAQADPIDYQLSIISGLQQDPDDNPSFLPIQIQVTDEEGEVQEGVTVESEKYSSVLTLQESAETNEDGIAEFEFSVSNDSETKFDLRFFIDEKEVVGQLNVSGSVPTSLQVENTEQRDQFIDQYQPVRVYVLDQDGQIMPNTEVRPVVVTKGMSMPTSGKTNAEGYVDFPMEITDYNKYQFVIDMKVGEDLKQTTIVKVNSVDVKMALAVDKVYTGMYNQKVSPQINITNGYGEYVSHHYITIVDSYDASFVETKTLAFVNDFGRIAWNFGENDTKRNRQITAYISDASGNRLSDENLTIRGEIKGQVQVTGYKATSNVYGDVDFDYRRPLSLNETVNLEYTMVEALDALNPNDLTPYAGSIGHLKMNYSKTENWEQYVAFSGFSLASGILKVSVSSTGVKLPPTYQFGTSVEDQTFRFSNYDDANEDSYDFSLSIRFKSSNFYPIPYRESIWRNEYNGEKGDSFRTGPTGDDGGYEKGDIQIRQIGEYLLLETWGDRGGWRNGRRYKIKGGNLNRFQEVDKYNNYSPIPGNYLIRE